MLAADTVVAVVVVVVAVVAVSCGVLKRMRGPHRSSLFSSVNESAKASLFSFLAPLFPSNRARQPSLRTSLQSLCRSQPVL